MMNGQSIERVAEDEVSKLLTNSNLSNLSKLSNLPAAIITRGDHVKPEAVDWIWPGWLAAGKMHLIAGDPGCGKTTIACALGATLTKGGRWPDGKRAESGGVLIWSGEDDVEDTLAPRLIAAGADMSRVYFVSGVREKGRTYPFDPSRDLGLLEDAATTMGDVRLIIIDPVVSAISGDSHKNAETRRGLQPLVDLARRLRASLLGVTHFSKGSQGRNPVERVTGSLAFGAVTRVLMVAAKVGQPDPNGDDRILVRGKSNIGPEGGGFAYALSFNPLPGRSDIVGSSVRWGESLEGDARSLLATAEVVQPVGPSPRDAVKEWLGELLAGGPVLTDRIKDEGKGAGHSWATMRRSLAEMGARCRKEVGIGGKWQWELPKRSKVAQLAQVAQVQKGEQLTCQRCDGEGCKHCDP